MSSTVERVHRIVNELFTSALISFESHIELLAHLVFEHRVREGLEEEDLDGAPLGADAEGGGGSDEELEDADDPIG